MQTPRAHATFLGTPSQASSLLLYIYINPSSPSSFNNSNPSALQLLLPSSIIFQEPTQASKHKQRKPLFAAHKISSFTYTAMHAPRRFKKAFMEQLLLSLQVAGLTSKSMGLRERRDAVKLSSDVAMASARGGAASWARALVARHAEEGRNEALLRRIMGSGGYERAASAAAAASRKEVRSRKIVRRSHRVCSSRRKRRSLLMAAAVSGSNGGGAMAARRMVKGRLQLLRKLVPGGEALHGFSLLTEALDYVVCLKTQVELMQSLCKGSQLG